MVLCGSYVTVTQNALDHRIIHADPVQIRRQASAEAMPAVPGDAGTLEHVLHFPLIARVQGVSNWNKLSSRLLSSLSNFLPLRASSDQVGCGPKESWLLLLLRSGLPFGAEDKGGKAPVTVKRFEISVLSKFGSIGC
jgi:hypothetical protein